MDTGWAPGKPDLQKQSNQAFYIKCQLYIFLSYFIFKNKIFDWEIHLTTMNNDISNFLNVPDIDLTAVYTLQISTYNFM